MKANPKFVKLLKGLLAATRKGRIGWETTASNEAFRTVFDRAIVRVGVRQDDDFEEPFHYALLADLHGRELESMTTQDLEEAELVLELYTLARRNALNVNTLIDDLLEIVGSGE